MTLFVPILYLDCERCETGGPVVGISTETGVQCTGLCGVCFFFDRSMTDVEEWNREKDSTE